MSQSAPGRRTARTVTLLALVAVVVYLLDLLTKTLAVHHLDPLNPTRVIGDLLTFKLIRNSGAAFSMATGYTWVLTIVALIVVLGIIRYSGKLRSTGWMIGLGLILGGALGNLTDRMFRDPGPLRGHVVDFIQVGSWWPTFNVADSGVVCGAVLLVVLTLLGYDYDGSRTGWAARRHPESADEAPADDSPADERAADAPADAEPTGDEARDA